MIQELDQILPHLDELPIFPLPSAVLLPFEMLPLHIFEPRYREMITDVLEAERPLAIAQLSSGWEGSYEGRPPVERICGVGVVSRSERLPDGRFNILLRGMARVEILEELPPRKAYREVRARLLNDNFSRIPLAEMSGDMESVRRMLFALCAARPGPAASALAQLAARATTPSALADIIAAALFSEVERRHKALVTLDAADRLSLAQSAIAELLVNVSPTQETRYRN
jgi:Lon protease-like protein